MKKILTVLILLAFVVLSAENILAQNEGVITYEITVNNHRNIPAEREGMKAMIPQYRTFKQQLFFNINESLYKPLIEDDEEEPQQGGGMRRFRMAGATNYFDQTSSIMVSQVDMM